MRIEIFTPNLMGILVEFPHETMCVNLLVMLKGKSELL